MRGLQYLLFLGLFGLSLSVGCTITTSDNLGKGGDGSGGEDNTSSGGKTAAGGTSAKGGATATGGAGVAGSSTTKPLFTAADCPAQAAVVPATVPDVTIDCVSCMYTKSCDPEAVDCQNDSACMGEVVSALECMRLYYLYNEETVLDGDSFAPYMCQTGENKAAPSDATITVKSTDPKAWLGTAVTTEAGTSLMVQLFTACAAECHIPAP